MGWNGSDRRGNSTPVKPKGKYPPSEASFAKQSGYRGAKKPSPLRGIVAGGLVCVLAVAAYFAFFAGLEKPKTERVEKESRRIKEVKPAAPRTQHSALSTQHSAPSTPSSIAKTFNEQVKEFIKKAPGTNKITWIVAPLDPDDPDNALRQGITQELGSLLSVEPGEEMPPFPYSFLIEDDMREAAAKGEEVGEIDNGNKAFLDSLKKWKIAAKETDDEHRLEHKQKLIEAQSELLSGLDEGISVNDAIRAAYQFRKRAYEMRSTIVETLTELHTKDGNAEDTIRQIKDMNNRLAEEGIKKIAIGEVIEDYEEPDEQP